MPRPIFKPAGPMHRANRFWQGTPIKLQEIAEELKIIHEMELEIIPHRQISGDKLSMLRMQLKIIHEQLDIIENLTKPMKKEGRDYEAAGRHTDRKS